MPNIAGVKQDLLSAVRALKGELWEELRRSASAEMQDDRKVDAMNSFIKRSKALNDEINLLLNDIGREFEKKPGISGTATPHNDIAVLFKKGTPAKVNIFGDEIEIRKQNEIPIVVANWLLAHGKTLPDIPNFIHRNKADFKMRSASLKQLNDGRFIEIGDHKARLIEKTKKILEACGFPGEVKTLEE